MNDNTAVVLTLENLITKYANNCKITPARQVVIYLLLTLGRGGYYCMLGLTHPQPRKRFVRNVKLFF